MATILLSIKPEYANKIFDGQKHYEYRKRIPKKEVSKIVVYSSAPEQAVIGEVEVVKTLKINLRRSGTVQRQMLVLAD